MLKDCLGNLPRIPWLIGGDGEAIHCCGSNLSSVPDRLYDGASCLDSVNANKQCSSGNFNVWGEPGHANVEERKLPLGLKSDGVCNCLDFTSAAPFSYSSFLNVPFFPLSFPFSLSSRSPSVPFLLGNVFNEM